MIRWAVTLGAIVDLRRQETKNFQVLSHDQFVAQESLLLLLRWLCSRVAGPGSYATSSP